MALSMTGYGRAEALVNGRDITVEIKSVNSRYFEYSSRIPCSCAYMDDKLKKLLSAAVSRGKVELSLQMQTVSAPDVTVQVNMPLAKSYAAALEAIRTETGAAGDVTAGLLARFPTCWPCAMPTWTRTPSGGTWPACARPRSRTSSPCGRWRAKS